MFKGIAAGSVLVRTLAVLVVVLVAGGAGYLTRGGGGGPELPAPPSTASAGLRGIVQSRTPINLTLSTDAGQTTVELTPLTRVEVLRPAGLSSLREGDWLNAGGVSHQQTLYAITALIAIPREILKVVP